MVVAAGCSLQPVFWPGLGWLNWGKLEDEGGKTGKKGIGRTAQTWKQKLALGWPAPGGGMAMEHGRHGRRQGGGDKSENRERNRAEARVQSQKSLHRNPQDHGGRYLTVRSLPVITLSSGKIRYGISCTEYGR